jgi:hypothetical protein
VHSLIQLAVEELKLHHAGDCVTCTQLRRGLKEALMYSLLSATGTHLHSQITAQNQLRNAEINLTYALRDFREHRKIGHLMNHSAPTWAAASRNAG